MKIEIVFLNPHKAVTKYANNMYDINEAVYDVLVKNGIEKVIAIDCASWAELATYGEAYSETDFDVYVSEE